METLTIEGKNFVKASKVANDFGYTSDYIGQLCRAEKVDAKLVGRSWYVELESLKHHKANRYKKIFPTDSEPQVGYEVKVKTNTSEVTESTTAQNSVVKIITGTEQERQQPPPTALPVRKNFYTRVTKPTAVPSYSEDDTDLIPAVAKVPEGSKTARLQVGLADASSVKISSKTAKYDFITPKRQKIAFKGSLDIDELPDPEPMTLPPDEPETVVINAEPKPAPAKKQSVSKLTKTIRRRSTGNVSMRRSGSLSRNKSMGTLEIPKVGAEQPQITTNRFILVVSTVAAVLIVMVLLGFEKEIVVTSSSVEEQLTFALDRLLAAVYGSK